MTHYYFYYYDTYLFIQEKPLLYCYALFFRWQFNDTVVFITSKAESISFKSGQSTTAYGRELFHSFASLYSKGTLGVF